MAIARVVGILVALVAIFFWFMLMVSIKGVISYMVDYVGVTPVALIIASLVALILRYANIARSLLWTLIRRSCS